MATFFSGTDNEELQENAPNHNTYLSLIVNNRMEMCARLAIKGVIKSSNVSFHFTDPDGNEFEVEQEAEEKTVVFYHDCNIQKPSYFVDDEDFAKRVEEICAVKPATTKTYGTPSTNVIKTRQANDSDDVETFIIKFFGGKGADTLDKVLPNFTYTFDHNVYNLIREAKKVKGIKLKNDSDELAFIETVLDIIDPYELDNLDTFKNNCFNYISTLESRMPQKSFSYPSFNNQWYGGY